MRMSPEAVQAIFRLMISRLEQPGCEVRLYAKEGKTFAYCTMGWIETPHEDLTALGDAS